MKMLNKTVFAALFAATLLAGCADSPTAPTADLPLTHTAAKGDKKATKSTSNGARLQWKAALDQDVSRSSLCFPSFPCRVWLFEVNSWVIIPAGALDAPTEITMTALAGSDVNFVFGPHGTQFNKNVSVVIDQALTTGSGANYTALYWVDDVSNVVDVIPAEMVLGFIQFETDHFSGYALGM